MKTVKAAALFDDNKAIEEKSTTQHGEIGVIGTLKSHFLLSAFRK